MKQLHVRALILVAALVWLGILLISGTSVPPDIAKPFSLVLTIVVALVTGFELYLWRLPILRGWFVERPDLRGTWSVDIVSLWTDPETSKKPAPIRAYFVVRQTYTTLSLRLLTSESTSTIVGCAVVRATDGPYIVSGVYRNEPRPTVRDRSPIHHGAFLLRVVGNPARSLEGEYWTDRKTTGELHAFNRKMKTFESYADAAEAFERSK